MLPCITPGNQNLLLLAPDILLHHYHLHGWQNCKKSESEFLHQNLHLPATHIMSSELPTSFHQMFSPAFLILLNLSCSQHHMLLYLYPCGHQRLHPSALKDLIQQDYYSKWEALFRVTFCHFSAEQNRNHHPMQMM